MPTTNSKGWEVQHYTHTFGWLAVSQPFATKAEAEQAMALMQDVPFPTPYRVYEALA